MARGTAAQVRALSVLLRHIADSFGCDRRVAAAAIQLCAALAAALPSKSGPGLRGFGLTGLADGGPEAEDAAAVLPLLARAGAVAFARAHADARADGCAEASADARARWTAELDGLSVALVRWLHSAVLSCPAERRALALMPAEVGPFRSTPSHARSAARTGTRRTAPVRHSVCFATEGATAARSMEQAAMGAAVHGAMRRQVDGFGAAAVHAGGSARADDAEEEGKAEALGLHVIRAVCALAMVCPAVALDTLVHSSLLVHVLMDAV